MALKKVKGTLERVLDKNLQDLVRGIRNHKDTEVGKEADIAAVSLSDSRQASLSPVTVL